MRNSIVISDITDMAMAEADGLALRKRMEEVLDEFGEVVLDFSGISLFATPFFNASVGYFIINLTPEKFAKVVSTKNLNELGQETYGHSLENAEYIFNNKIDTEVIGKITEDTIASK